MSLRSSLSRIFIYLFIYFPTVQQGGQVEFDHLLEGSVELTFWKEGRTMENEEGK